MKNYLTAALSFLPWFVSAAVAPTPSFSENKIGVPPLSLLEGSAEALQSWQSGRATGAGPLFGRAAPVEAVAKRKSLSNMPIVKPSAHLDGKLRIIVPDEATDYKMRVQRVEMESPK